MTPTPEQEAICREEALGVLATLRKDGMPQLTPINFVYQDGVFLISTTKDRAKYHNVKRSPMVSLCLVRPQGRPYVTIYGTARVEEEDIVDGTAAIFRRISDRSLPENFAEGLKQQRRVLIVMQPERFVP